MLRLLASAPAAAGFAWTEAEAQQAHTHAQAAQTAARKTGTAFKPKFFTAHEWATIGVLVDIDHPARREVWKRDGRRLCRSSWIS